MYDDHDKDAVSAKLKLHEINRKATAMKEVEPGLIVEEVSYAEMLTMLNYKNNDIDHCDILRERIIAHLIENEDMGLDELV